ncbi:MAG TPA: glycosyltransferase family 39 protein [Rhizomicrobium sp.]|nr:glycosyltransferase family 39 protein [Rhizomicrobium sp.]
MTPSSPMARRFGLTAPSFVLASAALLVHLFANGGYGIFRDELYFIVCGQRPDWGYVDQPPLIPLLAAASHWLFGGWLTGFRLIPALAMAATAAATAEFTRFLGGGRFAQWLSGLCALLAPFFLVSGLLFFTEMLQPIGWLACAFILIRLEQTQDERWWVPFGLVAGLSLLSKYVIAFYIVALAIGLVLTPLRRSLLRPWVYVGALAGALLVLPNVLWQQAHGWPFLELGRAAAGGKNVALSPQSFLGAQLLLIGPLAAPVWLAGLWVCVRKPAYAVFRAVPVAYVLLFAFFVATHGKAYFLASIYPILLAPGAIAWERWLANAAARGIALGLIALAGAVTVPLSLPVLPEETYIRYAAALGLGPSAFAMEHHRVGRLPQLFADMHGWPQLAAKVAKVYWALPPKDRAKAVFFGENYGEAAAIDVLGRPLGLPPAISGHNNYWVWGPRGHDGSVVIILGGDRKHYEALFRSVEVAGWIEDPYAMPNETGLPVYVLRGMKMPLSEYWPRTKNFR